MDEVAAAPKFSRDRRRRFERHMHSVVLAVIVLLIGWAGRSLSVLAEKAPVWDLRLQNLEIQMSGTYRSADAVRDVRAIETRLSTQEALNLEQQKLIDHNVEMIDRVLTSGERARTPATALPAPRGHG